MQSLEEFLEDFDLNDYPVSLYPPGMKEQHKIKEVIDNYPIVKDKSLSLNSQRQNGEKLKSLTIIQKLLL